MTLKTQLAEALKSRYQLNPGELPVMGFQVATLKGWAEAVKFLFELISTDSVELTEDVTIKLGTKGNIEYQRTGHSIVLQARPGIQVIFDAKIARVKPTMTGIILEKDKLKVLLDGFPDLTIGIED